MIVRLLTYQFESRNKIINTLRVNWRKYSFKNATFSSFSHPDATRNDSYNYNLPDLSQKRGELSLRSSISNFLIFGRSGSLQRPKTNFQPSKSIFSSILTFSKTINTYNLSMFLLKMILSGFANTFKVFLPCLRRIISQLFCSLDHIYCNILTFSRTNFTIPERS
jgi:hypothetical protein